MTLEELTAKLTEAERQRDIYAESARAFLKTMRVGNPYCALKALDAFDNLEKENAAKRLSDNGKA